MPVEIGSGGKYGVGRAISYENLCIKKSRCTCQPLDMMSIKQPFVKPGLVQQKGVQGISHILFSVLTGIPTLLLRPAKSIIAQA